MPVFETGAFNHSATCPAGSQTIGRGEPLQPGSQRNPNRRYTGKTVVDQRTGMSSFTLEIIVVDGSRLGVRYGLSTFDISNRILWFAGTRQ